MVASIVITGYLLQSAFILGPYDKAVPLSEVLHNVLGKTRGLHVFACSYTMLPIDNEEFPSRNFLPRLPLLVHVGHDTQGLFD
jgi:hypothetical protein